jgi:sulfur carrier protein ThiS
MRLTVKLYGPLRTGRFEERVVELPPGASVLEVIAEVGVPEKAVGILLVNGRHALIDHVACDGDRVDLMPPIGGG